MKKSGKSWFSTFEHNPTRSARRNRTLLHSALGSNPLSLRQKKEIRTSNEVRMRDREALAMLEVALACRLRASSTRSARRNRTLRHSALGSNPLSLCQKKNSAPRMGYGIFGGEIGIRTLDAVSVHTRFPVVRLRPTQPSLQAR